MIKKKKLEDLQLEMKNHNLFEKDIEEKFISGSGPGGQKVNKTQNVVYLKHMLSNIEVKCGKERSREDNRFFARRMLLEEYKKKVLGIKTEKEIEQEKIR